MSKPIINISDIELQPRLSRFKRPRAPEAAELFELRMGQISSRVGAQKLGYNLTAVPPGKRAFPLHNHRINEEMFFILEGSGEVRIGAERHPIRQGDIIACPTGGPETAHQIANTGDTDLKYLAVSTMQIAGPRANTPTRARPAMPSASADNGKNGCSATSGAPIRATTGEGE